jgi:hypothetical protein
MDITSIDFLLSLKAYTTKDNDLGDPVHAPQLKKQLSFGDGTTANNADIVWTDERTVSSASNDDLDLAGVLADAFGDTIAAAEIVGMVIVADDGNTTTLTIGAGSNPWATMWAASGDGIKVPPGGVFVIMAPDASGLGAVTAGTGDILRVANGSGAAATYKIFIIARSA